MPYEPAPKLLATRTRVLLALALIAALAFSAVWTLRSRIWNRPGDIEVLSAPLARALRAKDRGALDDVVRHISQYAQADADPETLKPRLHAYLRSAVVPKYLPLADDEAVRAYMRTTLAELDELRARSFYRCYVFLYGDGDDDVAQLRLENTLSAETREAGLDAIARLIDSAAAVPVSIDESAAWHVIDNVVMPRLPAWLGERKMVLRDPVSRDIDRVGACEVTIEVYKVAVELPAPDGPLVMRYLLARQLMDGV